MAHRFEPTGETTKDAMTDAEVRAVIERLSEERVAPKVSDVASIAGASEEDVRRVLEAIRAERAAEAARVAPEAVPVAISHRPEWVRFAIPILVLLMLVGLGLLFTMSSVRTVEAPPPPLFETPVQPAEGQPTVPANGPPSAPGTPSPQ